MAASKRLESLEAKRKQLDAQIQAIKARESAQARSEDNRRKIIIGGCILRMVKDGRMSESELTKILDEYVYTDRDRKFLGLAVMGEKAETAKTGA